MKGGLGGSSSRLAFDNENLVGISRDDRHKGKVWKRGVKFRYKDWLVLKYRAWRHLRKIKRKSCPCNKVGGRFWGVGATKYHVKQEKRKGGGAGCQPTKARNPRKKSMKRKMDSRAKASVRRQPRIKLKKKKTISTHPKDL